VLAVSLKNPVVDEEFFIKLKNKFPEIPAYELPDSKYKLAAGWLIEKIRTER